MRRKKLLWLTVPLMACMALFFSPPIGVDALSTTTPIDLGKKETWGADADREYITIRPCTGECEHIITGTFDASTITSNTLESIIQVEGGPHNIIFRNVNLSLNDGQNDDLHIRAFALGDTAVVNLTLEGDNVLRSAGAKSALYVPQQASLKILSKETPESTLQASSGFGSAGIGGDSNNGDCGNITINAPGSTITAASSGRGAGIGGGLDGKAGKIVIEAGTINASGGRGIEGEPAGPGIGATFLGTLNNTVVIRGGTVTAVGGTTTQGSGNELAYAIRGKTLSSQTDSMPPERRSVTITAVGGIMETTDTSLFDGLVWGVGEKGNVNEGRVYGDAILTDNVSKGQIIEIPAGTSLTPSKKVTNHGTITGGGILIDAPKITSPTFGTQPQIPQSRRKWSLDRDAITPSKEDTKDGKFSRPYSGEDQLDSIIKIADKVLRPEDSDPDDPNNWYAVDSESWNRTIKKDRYDTVTEIKEIGSYEVIYGRKSLTSTEITVGPIIITKAEITSGMITVLGSYSYTGGEIIPKLLIKLPNGYELKEKDYKIVSVTERDKEGTATVTIEGKGNCTGKASKDFKIDAASIEGASVELTSDPSPVYNAKKQDPKLVVKMGDKVLVPNQDYKIEYSPADLTDAGPVEISVTGINNYKDSVKSVPAYEIKQKPITIKSLAAIDRKYEKGRMDVDIDNNSVVYEGLEGNDKASDITIESKGNIANDIVGTYPSVTLPQPVQLGGNKGKNYEIVNAGEVMTLPPDGVEILQADAPAEPILAKDTYELSAKEGMFIYTATITNPDEREEVVYEYRMDGGEWQKTTQFDNIEPESKHIFEVRYEGNENIAGCMSKPQEITFTKLENPNKPVIRDFQFSLNPEGEQSFIGTIMCDEKNVEYFIGEKGGGEPTDDDYRSDEEAGSHLKLNCGARTEYVAYVRYRETATHQHSAPSTLSKTTDPLTLKAPIITPPDGTTFVGTQEVTIKQKAEVEGADLYYTIDGDTDTPQIEDSIRYEGDGSLVIGEDIEGEQTITIRAFAFKNKYEYEVAVAKLTKVLPPVETPVISLKVGEDNEEDEEDEFEHKNQEVMITCETEDAVIYYTLDGTEPTRESKKFSPKRPIKIDDTTVVKAFAIRKDGTMSDSAIAEKEFTRIWLDVAPPEIHPEEDVEVAGSKQVKLNCETEGAVIYYTTDGSDPTRDSNKYRNKPFRVTAPATIKAFAVKDDMNDSPIVSVSINKSESTVEAHTEFGPFVQDEGDVHHPLLSPELKEALSVIKKEENIEGDEVAAAEYLLIRELDVLGAPGDYIPENMELCNLKLWIKIGDRLIEEPKLDDFPAEGLTIKVKYPDEIVAATASRPEARCENYNYAIAHMVSEGDNVGREIERWHGERITKTPECLVIEGIKSASPLAIAWTTSQSEENKNKYEKESQPGGTIQNPDGSQTYVSSNPVSGSQGEGAAASGGSTGTGSVSDAVKSALSTILPKTGDTNKIIAWIVVAVVSVGVIIGVRMKSRKDKAKGKGKDKKDGKKTKK